jgi:hypothetical protein
MLATFGGQNLLRGYYDGRYRDKHAATLQAEYRRRLTGRWGIVAFAGAGGVAPNLNSFQLRNTRPSGGLGVRYLISKSEGINLRLDFGFGKGSSGVYFTGGEAF